MIQRSPTPALSIVPAGSPFGWAFRRGGAPVSSWSGLLGLGAGCPEGSRSVNGACVCYEGRVWMPDGSRCVSPQAPAYSGAITWQESMQGQTPDTYGQQELTAAARAYIQNAGHTINCKISDSWAAGPQGGTPARVCSIDGGGYDHAAYLINLNPATALTSLARENAAQQVSAQTGVAPGSLYTTPELAAAVNAAMQGHAAADAAAIAAAAPQTQPGAPTQTPAQQQQQASTPATTTTVPAGSSTTGATSGAASSSGPQPLSFNLTLPAALAGETWIPNVPNWAVLAGGAGLALFAFKK